MDTPELMADGLGAPDGYPPRMLYVECEWDAWDGGWVDGGGEGDLEGGFDAIDGFDLAQEILEPHYK